MIETTITIINKLGLHARASAKFVATCSKFQSHIEVVKGDKVVNGKSIMGVMMLAAQKNAELTLRIDGPDEAEMEQALKHLILTRFGEED